MIFLTPDPGKGLTIKNHKLTLNFDPSINVDTSDGVLIDSHDLGGGLEGVIDRHTIIPYSKDASDNTLLGVNTDVVSCVFSMCQYKVTTRGTSVDQYVINKNQNKTIEDVIREMNAVMDYYDSAGRPFPDGMAHTTYKFKIGDFFQFRKVCVPYQVAGWPVPIDDANRNQNTPITAFFYIQNVEYVDGYRLHALTLLCIWSSIASYVAGTTYTANDPTSNNS